MYETTGFMNEHELEGSRSGSKSGPCVIAACVMIETETQSTNGHYHSTTARLYIQNHVIRIYKHVTQSQIV